MPRAFVVENFNFVQRADFSAFREARRIGECAGEGAVFRVKRGQILVNGNFKRIAAERRDKIHKLRCVQVERRMERRESLGKEPFRGKRIRRIQTVIADEGYSGILEYGE